MFYFTSTIHVSNPYDGADNERKRSKLISQIIGIGGKIIKYDNFIGGKSVGSLGLIIYSHKRNIIFHIDNIIENIGYFHTYADETIPKSFRLLKDAVNKKDPIDRIRYYGQELYYDKRDKTVLTIVIRGE